jgi:ribosomal protein S12 methylthiotransferase accessory factor
VTFALDDLDATPVPPLEEALYRAHQLVGPETGMVRGVFIEETAVDGPRAYIATAEPAEATYTLGTPALNRGMAASCDRDRALMKAVGESIERYCGAFPGEMVLSSAARLAGAVAPERFELFTPQQYDDPAFSLPRFDDDTVMRWVEGTSLATGNQAYLPGVMVYVPHQAVEGEVRVCDQISTGLACAHSRSSALAKGIMEVVERDALMITWHNRLPAKRVRYDLIDDPFVRAASEMFEGMALRVDLYCVTVDVPVPVVLGVGRSTVEQAPYTVLGLGTASDPVRAVGLALEEVALGVWGVRVNAAHSEPEAGGDWESLEWRGSAYALQPELGANLAFLDAGPEVEVSELPRVEASSPLVELRALTSCLTAQGLEPFGFDLTTDDVDSVGFKVCRVIVPGMRPLDIKHSRRFLGGGRLYDVPVELGLRAGRYRTEELNQDPHPFP